MAATSLRLTAEDWLHAGFTALVDAGPQALKAEPLARALGTTKGSFYWHFKDVPDYRSRLIKHWEAGAVSALSRAIEAGGTSTERLHRLPDLTSSVDGGAAEPAIRAWASYDHTVANAVADVDAARLAYVGSILEALGLTNPEFARLLYAAQLGMQRLPGDAAANDSALSTLTAALLALQEA